MQRLVESMANRETERKETSGNIIFTCKGLVRNNNIVTDVNTKSYTDIQLHDCHQLNIQHQPKITYLTPMKFKVLLCAFCIIGSNAIAQESKTAIMQQKAKDLIAQMTVEEKIDQLMNATPGIKRLGIKPYNYWSEALHGVARNGKATVFPEPIGMGASFNPELIRAVGEAISDEARAKFDDSQRLQRYGIYAGLTFWSPNVNIFRDPRWGRGMETFGEDPYLTGIMGSAFVRGMQGSDPFYLKTATCAKHFAIHSGPENQRHSFDACPSQKDLFETYLPAFRTLVKDAKVEIVMGAYNRVFGKSASGSDYLLTDFLRKQWGFEGHIVSDCGAVTDIWQGHKLAADGAEACAIAIKAGLNVECGDTFQYMGEALLRGLLTEADLDKALLPLLMTRIKLGILFDDPECPYNHCAQASTILSKEHVELALKSAQETMVLLKNSDVLPLDKNVNSICVVGAGATDIFSMFGNYYGVSNHYTTYLEGIVDKVSSSTSVIHRSGFMYGGPNLNSVDWSYGDARGADICILVLGNTGNLEGEEGDAIGTIEQGDRTTLMLPKQQMEYFRRISKDHKNKLITVITGGSPVDMREIYAGSDAVIQVWYPGQEGGTALADLLFGDANFSGRLPMTVPLSTEVLPPFDSYDMHGRTYKYMDYKDVLFPFGYGLSYGKVKYENARILNAKPIVDSRMAKKGKQAPIQLQVTVTNEGSHNILETVQLYLSAPGADAAKSQLIGLRKIEISAGSTDEVTFDITPQSLMTVQQDGKESLVKGTYTLNVGAASPGKRSNELDVSMSSTNLEVR